MMPVPVIYNDVYITNQKGIIKKNFIRSLNKEVFKFVHSYTLYLGSIFLDNFFWPSDIVATGSIGVRPTDGGVNSSQNCQSAHTCSQSGCLREVVVYGKNQENKL